MTLVTTALLNAHVVIASHNYIVLIVEEKETLRFHRYRNAARR